jgi:hypothetical protein
MPKAGERRTSLIVQLDFDNCKQNNKKAREVARVRSQRNRERLRKLGAKKSSAKFVEAKLPNGQMPKSKAQDGDQIEIATPNGTVIKLPGSTTSALLFAVLQALR